MCEESIIRVAESEPCSLTSFLPSAAVSSGLGLGRVVPTAMLGPVKLGLVVFRPASHCFSSLDELQVATSLGSLFGDALIHFT